MQYRVLYKPIYGFYKISDPMSLDEAKKFKQKLLDLDYMEETVFIITIIG